MFMFILGTLSCCTYSYLYKIITDRKRFMCRPVLQDGAFNILIEGIKSIKYDNDKLEDQDRLKVLRKSKLLKQYKLTYEQSLKLKKCFTYINTTQKMRRYIHYPLLLNEKVINMELELIDAETQKLLEGT